MAGKPFLSLSMIVKNEEAALDACLRSARALCDEIVVVDTGSTDRTVEIAQQHGARILHFAWCDDFAAARNFALDHTSGEWVLHLDADEITIEGAPGALRAELAAQPVDVRFLRVPVRSLLPDGMTSDEHTARRLFRRGPAVRWVRRIHENIVGVDGESASQERTTNALRIDHFGYENPELRKNQGKNSRNIRLLTREILENPRDAVPHFYLAREHASIGDNDLAVQMCRNILDRWAGRLAPALEGAIRCQAMRSALACGDPARAAELGRPGEAIAEGSELPFLLGRALLELGDFDGAERALLRALELGSTFAPMQATEGTGSWRPLLELATLARRRGETDAAVQRWLAAVSAAPTNPAVRLVAGKGLLAIGRAADAAVEISRALELKPDLHEAQLRLSEAAVMLGDTQDAYDRLDALVREHPEIPDHWQWLGSLLCQVGELEAAVDVLGDAIGRHQEHAGVYVTLGTALQKLGRHEDALNAFALAQALDPVSDVARAGVAVSAYHQANEPGGR